MSPPSLSAGCIGKHLHAGGGVLRAPAADMRGDSLYRCRLAEEPLCSHVCTVVPGNMHARWCGRVLPIFASPRI
jgi:hypothetical protein